MTIANIKYNLFDRRCNKILTNFQNSFTAGKSVKFDINQCITSPTTLKYVPQYLESAVIINMVFSDKDKILIKIIVSVERI